MTFMDRQHSLTTRFVFMVSAMNIHGSTNRTTRTNRRNTIRAQWCEVKKTVSLPSEGHGSQDS